MIATFLRRTLLGLSALSLTACVTTTPPTAVHQPMSARPVVSEAATPSRGSIYASTNRSLFEDRRARFVGDLLTINIAENVQASKKSDTKASRAYDTNVAIPTYTGLPLNNQVFKDVMGIGMTASNATGFTGAGENTSSNNFTGTISVTVIEVYPNGNLLVSGEKQIGLKEGEEFVRFSGVVNPVTISISNTVQSTQVADARIEYKANGFIDTAQVMGWLGRFFLTFLPF